MSEVHFLEDERELAWDLSSIVVEQVHEQVMQQRVQGKSIACVEIHSHKA